MFRSCLSRKKDQVQLNCLTLERYANDYVTFINLHGAVWRCAEGFWNGCHVHPSHVLLLLFLFPWSWAIFWLGEVGVFFRLACLITLAGTYTGTLHPLRVHFAWTLGALENILAKFEKKVNFWRGTLKTNMENFNSKEDDGGFVVCSFVWPGWDNELTLLATLCDVHFLSANRQGVHLIIVYSLHEACYVCVWLANVS